MAPTYRFPAGPGLKLQIAAIALIIGVTQHLLQPAYIIIHVLRLRMLVVSLIGTIRTVVTIYALFD